MMKFRDDIQVLRGVSVLFVVLFHLGFSSLRGGFLGVDVFFVISGFLMAVLYDFRNKIEFFKRRAKRLLPPYFFVIIFTVLVAFIFTTPNETEQVVTQAIFSSFFASNIGFWLQNSYFSKAEFNPLLHLWSLGVEIQFYLFIPLLSWFFRKSKIFLPLILASSLILCFVVLTISPKTSFFMLPLRLWEFLIGFGIAQYFTLNGQVRYKGYEWLGLISAFALVVIPFMPVDGKSLSVIFGHPGLLSLLVCLATSGVLLFGIPSFVQQSFIGRTLVWFGKYSYSIYLVHFPIIVLFLFEPFGGTIVRASSHLDLAIIISLIGFFSYLSFSYIEKMKFTRVFSWVIAGSTTVIVFPLLLTLLQGKVISENERNIFGAFTDRATYRCGKLIRVLEPAAISCVLNSVDNPRSTIMLIGNSHADSIKTSLSSVLTDNENSLLFLVPNDPLMKGGMTVARVFEDALERGVDKIVIHYSTRGFPLENVIELTNIAIKQGIEVVVIEPVPFWSEHIPQYMYTLQKGKSDNLAKSVDSYLEDNNLIFQGLDSIHSELFKRISVSDVFCSNTCIFSNQNGVPLYFDSNHLTLTGARMLEDKFRNTLVSEWK